MINLLHFLEQSNAIEDVWDLGSLQQAYYAWEYLIEVERMTVGAILKTHKILMLHQPLRPDEKGYFRKIPVYVGGYACPPPLVIGPALSEWVDDLNGIEPSPGLDPEGMHIRFEKIHPFVDGNGRIGRILLNWQRVRKENLPILVIEEKEKNEYYKWFTTPKSLAKGKNGWDLTCECVGHRRLISPNDCICSPDDADDLSICGYVQKGIT